MKLLDFPGLPNPRRVRIFLAEKDMRPSGCENARRAEGLSLIQEERGNDCFQTRPETGNHALERAARSAWARPSSQ
jgi:hypothetical protein